MKIVEELIKLSNTYNILLLIENEKYKEALALINTVEYNKKIIIKPVVQFIRSIIEIPFISYQISGASGSKPIINEMQTFSEFNS